VENRERRGGGEIDEISGGWILIRLNL
jgi:hypothetical protein